MKLYKKTIALVLCTIVLCATFFIVYKNGSEKEELSYEAFTQTCDTLYKALSTLAPFIALPPDATVYDGNPEKAWTKDGFTILEGQAIKPKQKEYVLYEDQAITKVLLSYTPYIADKNYVSVDRMRQSDLERMGVMENEILPIWSENEFTVNGIAVSVETVGVFETKEAEEALIQKNGQFTQMIQEKLLEMEG